MDLIYSHDPEGSHYRRRAGPGQALRRPSDIGAAGLLSELPNRLEDQDLVRLATLGMMTVGIAHDLGNLLQVVASAVRLIDRKLDPGARTEFAPLTEGALNSVDRAAALSRRILDLGKSKSAINEITCLARTLASLKDLVALTTGPKITVEFSSQRDLPAVICNSRELENVILNLVINARDAMAGEGRLVLATRRESGSIDVGDGRRREGVMVVLQVTDDGCGMSPQVMSQVFQPFFSTKADGRGAGLGLAMVSDFARRTGGSAEIESVVNLGTTVTIRLPGCAA